MSDADIEEIFKNLDYKGNHMINYSDFLVATLDRKTIANDQKLESVFAMFNTQDEKDGINAEEMKEAFEKLD